MKYRANPSHSVRWSLSVALVVLGLLITWAWGEVADLAASPEQEQAAQAAVVYAAWQPDKDQQPGLFRTADEGGTWQPLLLPQDAVPAEWVSDGQDRLAVISSQGTLLRSDNRGQDWVTVAENLAVLSLAWAADGTLYAGTDGQGVYRIAAGQEPVPIAPAGSELAQGPVAHLAMGDVRLFAGTRSALFYSDDGGRQWNKSLPVPASISALVAADANTVYAGTTTVGVFKSTDAGRSWEPSVEGLGLAAGQAVDVTALAGDPREPGVLYAAVDYVLGGTHVHSSAQGTFVTVDAGESWQPLAGPVFPEAQRASALVPVSGRSLSILAVTPAGLQAYQPDVSASMAALEDANALARARAARLLGLARARDASHRLLAALADSDPAVSLAAANALGHINDPANAGDLLVALDHPEEQVRLGAARALGLMKNEPAVKPLGTMLLTGRGAEVSVAAEALGRVGSSAAVDPLLAALADAELTPRRHAALGVLESMGDTVVEPLAAMLAVNREPAARRNAAEALGWIASPRATSALVAALKDRDEAVRRQAAWALGETGDPAARAALQRAASRDDSALVQAEAQTALEQLAATPLSEAVASQPASLAAALHRLQPVRWLVLIGTWTAAAWLALTSARLVPVPAALESRRREGGE